MTRVLPPKPQADGARSAKSPLKGRAAAAGTYDPLDMSGPRSRPGTRGPLDGRMVFLLGCFAFGFAALAFRAGQVALFRDVDVARTSARAAVEQSVDRADITDRNGVLLATSVTAFSLYADPERIWDPVETARALRTVFPQMDEAALVRKLSSRSRFEFIQRRLTPSQKRAVWELAQPGLEFVEESRRVYPQGALAGHLLGLSNRDGDPITGIERAMDDRLTAAADGTGTEPLALSIDSRVQHVVEAELDQAARLHQAAGGAAVILDVHTGEVIASASWPQVDPNVPAGRQANAAQVNRAVNAVYEMGSTFKVFTVAVGLNDGILSPDKVYDARQPLTIGNRRINDFHAENRALTVQEILSHSSNIGTARIAADIGALRLEEFFGRLGLTAPVAGELKEVSRPILPPRWGRIQAATASYGHGIAVTPMAVAAGYAAIGNDGTWLRPTFLARADGNAAASGRSVLSPIAARQTVQLMREVVAHGTGGRADVDGYPVAGKTGTAEKPRTGGGGYDSDRRVSSFAGIFPADAPRYAIVVLLDEPQGAAETGGVATAGVTAAPVVSRVVARSAPLLGLMPRRTYAELSAAR